MFRVHLETLQSKTKTRENDDHLASFHISACKHVAFNLNQTKYFLTLDTHHLQSLFLTFGLTVMRSD
jgi:hypothetical protein